MAVFGTYDEIADFMLNDWWGASGPRKWDIGPGGVITVNISGLTAAGQNLALAALQLWEDVANVDFQIVTTSADITIDDNQPGAFFNGPAVNGFFTAATINIEPNFQGEPSVLNSNVFFAYVHEIGHLLSLGHPGHYDGSNVAYSTHAFFSNDSYQLSTMSYFSQAANTTINGTRALPLMPMIADIIGVQLIYGAAPNTRSGDTIYGVGSNAGSPLFDPQSFPNTPIAVTIYDTGGIDTLKYDVYSANQVFNLNPEGISNVAGLIGNLIIARGVDIENAIGGLGDDSMFGNALSNSLIGEGGDDELFGGDGADTLDGGTGDDVIMADAGDDHADGHLGNDTIFGGAGADTIDGAADDDSISGGTGRDSVLGGDGADTIFGDDGNDKIAGGRHDDAANGGNGYDFIMGEDGADLIFGDSLADTLIGGNGNDTLNGGIDNDRLFGEAQRDLIFGDAGDDIIDAGTGNDTVDGGNQRDSVFGGSGFDSIDGGNGNDTLTGGTDGDTLLGDAGFDILQGDAGDDVLNGGASNDVIFGNAGNDTIIFDLGGGTDTLRDFTSGAASEDVINLVGFGAAFDSFAEVIGAATQTGNHVTIDFGNGDTLIIRNTLVASLHADDFAFG